MREEVAIVHGPGGQISSCHTSFLTFNTAAETPAYPAVSLDGFLCHVELIFLHIRCEILGGLLLQLWAAALILNKRLQKPTVSSSFHSTVS